jgi:hypothetical protein
MLHLQVGWGIPAPQDSHMKRLVVMMACHDGVTIVKYDKVFF